jgi:hypothetical protein
VLARILKKRSLGKKELRGLKEMTPELKQIVELATQRANIDDTWFKACDAEFGAGGT